MTAATTMLAYFPSPPRGVWHLGPVPIRAYALCIITGIVAALVIGDRRWAARGGERGVIYDVALWAVPFGLVGGRLYHLFTDWRTYFGDTGAGVDAAMRIWDGGLGIWGAVAFGGVGAWIGCRRRGIPLPAFGDAIAPGIVLAQAIGRVGNYFNQELYGRETTLPWGMQVFYRLDPSGIVDVHSLDGVSTGQVALIVQPTFLYELLCNLALFAVLLYADRRFMLGHGRLFALYVAGYCVGRFWVELLRADPATMIADIRVNTLTATFVFIAAVVYVVLAPNGREDPAMLGGVGSTEAPAAKPGPDAADAVPATGFGGADGADGEATATAETDSPTGKEHAEDAESVEDAEDAESDDDAVAAFWGESEADEPDAAESEIAESDEDGFETEQPGDEDRPTLADEEVESESESEPSTEASDDDADATGEHGCPDTSADPSAGFRKRRWWRRKK